MLITTIKGLWAHKVRLALTALAVVLGVSFVAGTFVLTDTVNAALGHAFTNATPGAVTVRSKATYSRVAGPGDVGPAVKAPSVPDSLVATVAAAPGVAAAGGTVQGDVTVVAPATKPASSAAAPTYATNWPTDPALSPMTLRNGRAPANGTEVALDAHTVASERRHLGGTVTVLSSHAPRSFTLVGVIAFGPDDTLAGITYAVFDGPTAQALVGTPGQWDSIVVASRPGVTPAALARQVGAVVPPGVEAVTSAAVTHETASALEKALGMLTTFLLAFALVATFVGTFIIANTFNILVTQRTRELALLRALGASRAQVTVSVVTEATIIGAVASAVGVAAGIGVAAGLQAMIAASGWGLPSGSPQLLGRTVIVAVGTGMVATITSAVVPARRASKVAPVAAMSDTPAAEAGSLGRRMLFGSATTAAGAVALGYGIAARPTDTLTLVGAGAAVLFVGVAMLSPLVVGPMARLIGRPLSTTQGVSGHLARHNAMRSPRRTAATAAALMVGVAVVAVVATLGSSQVASTSKALDATVRADFVITGPQRGFTPAVATAVSGQPGVGTVAELRQGVWHAASGPRQLSAVDPAAAPRAITIAMRSGTETSLADGDVLVDTTTAAAEHLSVGQTLPMGFDRTGTQHMRIGGTYEPSSLLGSYVISTSTYGANYATVADEAVFVTAAGSPAEAQAAVTRAAATFPDVTVKDQVAYKAQQRTQASQGLSLVYALVALSILIALVGIVNTLALSVIERTRELGLLRAVGMGRRQVRRMIRGETVIVCVIGAVLGATIGTGLGVAVTHAIGLEGTAVTVIPVTTLTTVVAICGGAGLVAAIWPARRAARLNVLQAIASQ